MSQSSEYLIMLYCTVLYFISILILWTYGLLSWNVKLMAIVKDTQNHTFEHLNQNMG